MILRCLLSNLKTHKWARQLVERRKNLMKLMKIFMMIMIFENKYY